MVSIAAVLFVKNEVDDIGWWIAHHLAVGFTSLIIFDDHSTDGTWEVLNQARSIHDIHIHRTDPSEANFYWRQRNAYLEAIRLYGEKFEWLGFFDGDEYFYPIEDSTVGAFLARFPEAHGVAVSWCTYGSGSHAFKPLNAPIEAYTTHSKPDLSDNELIKSFIRPKHFLGAYKDPHRWDVDDALYVDPTGKPVEWLGSSGMAPQWERAKVLHFVCRSMQHYLERIARRSDLYDSTAFWNHFDRNEIQDLRPLRLLPDIRRLNAQTGQAGLIDLHWQLKQIGEDPTGRALEAVGLARPAKLGQPAVEPAVLHFAHIDTLSGNRLFLDPDKARVRNAPVDALPPDSAVWLAHEPFNAGVPGHAPRSRGILFAGVGCSEQAAGLPVDASPVLLDCVPVVLEEVDGGLTMRSPVSHHYFSADPENGSVEANRGGSGAGERFVLAPAEPSAQIRAIAQPFAVLVGQAFDLRSLAHGLARLEAPLPSALGAALAFLPAEEQKRVMQRFPGRVPSWLRNWLL